jgi:hypothetical protein
MGLTLIEAAKDESRLEHLAVIKTFSEGELLARLPFMTIVGAGFFSSVEKDLPSTEPIRTGTPATAERPAPPRSTSAP